MSNPLMSLSANPSLPPLCRRRDSVCRRLQAALKAIAKANSPQEIPALIPPRVSLKMQLGGGYALECDHCGKKNFLHQPTELIKSVQKANDSWQQLSNAFDIVILACEGDEGSTEKLQDTKLILLENMKEAQFHWKMVKELGRLQKEDQTTIIKFFYLHMGLSRELSQRMLEVENHPHLTENMQGVLQLMKDLLPSNQEPQEPCALMPPPHPHQEQIDFVSKAIQEVACSSLPCLPADIQEVVSWIAKREILKNHLDWDLEDSVKQTEVLRVWVEQMLAQYNGCVHIAPPGDQIQIGWVLGVLTQHPEKAVQDSAKVLMGRINPPPPQLRKAFIAALPPRQPR